jgi:hypothetical protein
VVDLADWYIFRKDGGLYIMKFGDGVDIDA